MKHKISRFKHNEANRQILLGRMTELGLTQYNLIIKTNKDVLMNIWDDKNSSTANITFNLTKGVMEDVDTGAVIVDQWFTEEHGYETVTDDYNMSGRISAMIEVERELQR